MKDQLNIDELLNSYVDGELPERLKIEVQRMAAHDPLIAGKLKQLEKCRMLVSSLPRPEAPAEMLQRIRASLSTRAILARQLSPREIRIGERHLFGRRLLAAAAMIVLVALLGAVIYTILAPQGGIPKQPPMLATGTAKQPDLPWTQFNGRLELKTADLLRVDSLIKRAIENAGISGYAFAAQEEAKNVYTLACSRDELAGLLADLQNVWNKLQSASLFVHTDQFGKQVAVNGVTCGQIQQIVAQDGLNNRLETARYFAASNKINQLMPGTDVLVAIEGQKPDRTTIRPPRPVMTGQEKTVSRTLDRDEKDKCVRLTVVLTGTR